MEGMVSLPSGRSSNCSHRSSNQCNHQNEACGSDCSERSGIRGQPSAPTGSPSFLCFLPESHGRLSLVHSKGTAENFFDSSGGCSPLSSTRKGIQMHNAPYSTVRSVHSSTIVAFKNGYKKVDSTCGDASSKIQEAIPEARNDVVINGGHESYSKAVKDATQTSAVGSRNADFLQKIEHAEDLLINNDPVREDLGVEDELAFEITEFFKAFDEGHEYLLMSVRGQLESSVERVSMQAEEALECSKINSPTIDQSSSDDLGSSNVLEGEQCADTVVRGHWSNAVYPNDVRKDGEIARTRQNSQDDVQSMSGKWYEEIDAGDPLLVTFSGPVPFSGPISYSGHSGQVPYSGSLSHRSDSSTASTHSFAFPILPCEWNSSPVKMPQPDQRYMRHRWRRRLCTFFCCKSHANRFD